MNLYFVIGFIVGIGFYTGVRTIQVSNRKLGMIQLVLTFLAPVSVYLWCLKKTKFVFGGTDWEFFIQTATVDRMIEPWLILVLYIGLLLFTLYNIVQLRKMKIN